jgi:glycerophosphoryl diester phosphodiesterase
MIRDLLKHPPLAVAHRGDPMKLPQNTRSSFLSALEYDIDMIETDLNMTRDGRLVIIHDQVVDFTSNGKGEVNSYMLADLRRLDFGSWMGPGFSGETIMTLEELLDLVKGRDVALNIEIKNGPRIYEGIEEKVVSILNDLSAADRVIVSSFDHTTIRHIKEIAPNVLCGILFSGALIDPITPARLAGADGLHPEYSSVHEPLVSAALSAGLFVNVWTVDSEEQMKRMAALGVTGILSNYPERLVGVLKGSSGISGA